MHASSPFDRTTQATLLGAGLLFMLAGAGWTWFGADIFLNAIMAGLAYCF